MVRINTVPKLVIFDLFGTLVKFGIMHHPYRKLLKWARENGRAVQADDARYLMTTNLNVTELAASMSIHAPQILLDQINKEIDEELQSLALYDDVYPVFEQLNSQGVAIAICSNLAKPYGEAVELLPPEIPLLKGLSYELGTIKPEPEIYAWILKTAGVDAAETLFIGDTFIADYEGPIKMGIPALHLTRKGSTMPHEISSLREII